MEKVNGDTDKILLEDGNCILYEENGYINHIEKVNKDNNSNWWHLNHTTQMIFSQVMICY